MKKIGLFLLLLVGVLFLTGCDDGKSVVGRWEYQNKNGNYKAIYVFNKDGTGIYTLKYSDQSEDKNFTYEVKDENLVITFEGFGDPFELKYRREQGKLIITDSSGNDNEFKKK